ncbi:MAG: helix-turn-helix transcriptional regulator [Firmicutes bacterium]|jgi:transcriptional regulator with XRE-family HTH domain|nr:helix-turn-helix transcriptional regulator [Bacillota bacterium]
MRKLKELRKSANLKQQELAEILNLDASSISKYETGKATPSPDILLKIANYFHVTTDYLLNNDIQLDKEQQNINDIPLSVDEGALLLQEKLKGISLVNEQGVITKEGAEIFATFLINNADMLKKLLNDKNNP